MSNIKVKVSITQVLITIVINLYTVSSQSGIFVHGQIYPTLLKDEILQSWKKSLLILFVCVPWFIVVWFFILPLIFQVSHPDLFPYCIIVFLRFSAPPPCLFCFRQALSLQLFDRTHWDLFIPSLNFSVKQGKLKIAIEMMQHISALSIFLLIARLQTSDALSLTPFPHRLHWLHSYYIVVRCLNCYRR